MEDFIDYILFLVLLGIIGLSGLLIYLLLKHPVAGYWLLGAYIGAMIGGGGLWGWRIHKRHRLGVYQEILHEITRSKKDIIRAIKHSDSHLRKSLKRHIPKIRQLVVAAHQRIDKILEIDKILLSFNQQQPGNLPLPSSNSPQQSDAIKNIYESEKRFQKNIQAIVRSKHQYFQDIQQIMRVMRELNSQMLALKYSHEQLPAQHRIEETIDELLLEMEILDEIERK